MSSSTIASSDAPTADLLVVDDHPSNLKVLSSLLKIQGYKVRKATSGSMALRAIETTPPDLILLDIMMPEMNGYQVCSQLKASAAYADIPVIFLSALDEVLDKVKAFQVGGSDYISKPFQAEEVLARIEHQLTIRRQKQQLLAQNLELQQQIQQRQQAEASLEESQQKLARLIDSLPGIVFTCANDPDWSMRYLSRGCLDLTGYSGEELVENSSLNYNDLIQPQDFPQLRQTIASAIAAHQPYVVEYRIRDRARQEKWLWEKGHGVWSSSGQLRGVEGFISDISDLKQAELALRESQQRLEIFFSQSLDGFFFMMLDQPIRWDETLDKVAVLNHVFRHQHITKANAALLAQYGCSEAEFLGKTPAELFAHDLETAKAIWQEMFNQGRLHVETDQRRFDGSPIAIEGNYICLYDAEGRITGHFGIQRDITAAKRIEAEREMAVAQLKTSLQEKTALLQEVHHRVKNNLQVISSLLRLQSKRVKDMKVQEILEDSQNRVLSMSLVHQILYQTENYGQVSLDKYVRTLSPYLFNSLSVSLEKVKLHVDIAADATVSLNRAIPLGLILNELITNALKHGLQRGDRRGDIWIELKDAGDRNLTLTVANNGLPLPEDFGSHEDASMGIKLVTILVDQLQASLNIQRGETTRFSITLDSTIA